MNASRAADFITFALQWIHSHVGVSPQGLLHTYHVISPVSPLTFAITLVLVVILYYACKTFSREEMWNMYDILMCFFTAELSFLTLMLNGVWFLGQTLDGFCKLLTLN